MDKLIDKTYSVTISLIKAVIVSILICWGVNWLLVDKLGRWMDTSSEQGSYGEYANPQPMPH